jgi:hypothetical protein
MRFGYVFYVSGMLPPNHDATKTDAKITKEYGTGASRWVRCRRKKQGLANVIYLRHGAFFVIMATPGEHPFFQKEGRIEDCRKRPLLVDQYSISLRDGKVSVRISTYEYKRVKNEFLAIALHPAKKVEAKFRSLPWLKYTPIRKQKADIFKAVSKKRRKAGLSHLSFDCIMWKTSKPKTG